MSGKFTAIVATIQACIVFTLVTQSDVSVPNIIRFVLGLVAVGLTAYAANATSDPTTPAA